MHTDDKFGVSWPEGQPEKVVTWHTHVGKNWAEFWVGIKTYWPNPLNAKRVSSAWWWTEYEGTPIEIASDCDRYMSAHNGR